MCEECDSGTQQLVALLRAAGIEQDTGQGKIRARQVPLSVQLRVPISRPLQKYDRSLGVPIAQGAITRQAVGGMAKCFEPAALRLRTRQFHQLPDIWPFLRLGSDFAFGLSDALSMISSNPGSR